MTIKSPDIFPEVIVESIIIAVTPFVEKKIEIVSLHRKVLKFLYINSQRDSGELGGNHALFCGSAATKTFANYRVSSVLDCKNKI